MQVVIMGLGYIGLPTAALIAGKDNAVHGVDINSAVVETINKGKIHIVEPELEGLVHNAIQKKYLEASTTPKAADVFVIAVPTPFKENHKPDTSYVEQATRMVIPFLKEGNLFIIESTSPVGTTEKMAELIIKERPEMKDKLFVAYCPERVLPGNIIHELQHNDRVIGGIDAASTEAAAGFYSGFVKGQLHPTNSRTAELCKLTENAYRDVNIAFANELSMICERADINVNELIDLASKHPRVKILKPGPGVGGHCIAVDPWFIVSDFPEEARLITTARQVNDYKQEWVIDNIRKAALAFEEKNKRKPVIACMGLTYKADIDDIRESPALSVYHELKKNYQVHAVEPYLNKQSTDNYHLSTTAEAVFKADLIVFLVAHKQFRTMDVSKAKVVLDFCGVLK